MIDPAQLAIDHRTGAPPPTASLVGTLGTPDGSTVVVAFGRGGVVLCWWMRTPTFGARRALHRFHGFAPLPPRRRRSRRQRQRLEDRVTRSAAPDARTFPCPGCGRALPAVRWTDRDFTVCVCCKLDRIGQALTRRETLQRIAGPPGGATERRHDGISG